MASTINEIEETNNNVDNDLSELSISSYDSLDNQKLEKMGQYTCDECNEIPKIIQTNPKRSTILIRCKEHGLKELKLQSYILNSQNYNPNNWKCADSVTFQKDCKTNFKYCQCGTVFCDQCIGVHQKVQSHSNTIDSDKYYIRCKEGPDHFDKPFKGFCYECNTNYCSECEKIHKNHQKVLINSMYIKPDDIESIKKANKEYEKRISYYQNLIKLNNLIIYSYENNRDNYYNLFNINNILKDIKRNIVTPLQNEDNKGLFPGEKNSNYIHYMNNLYNLELKEEETVNIRINNQFFNNFDLNLLTQIPLHNLKMLELDNNSISKIDCLDRAEFPELVVLSLKNNSIEDISVLERVKFVDIQALLLSNNSITDISVFGKTKFTKLRLIDLRNNNILDIGVFKNYGKEKLELLQCLYLSGNKYDSSKRDETKKLLENCAECVL
jgi:hypothetical protein